MVNDVIYDVGSNNGDDIPYYLMRADKVVAIEANPNLCETIRCRFKEEIDEGRLILVDGAATAANTDGTMTFGVHKFNHVLSSAVFDGADQSFEKIEVKSYSLSKLIHEHGKPLYVKIDIEGSEADLFEALSSAGICPKFISVEIHDPRGALLLLADKRYKYFNIVDGKSVSEIYKNHALKFGEQKTNYSFPHHSAGPFGLDIKTPWTTRKDTVFRLATTDFGWKDFHATSEEVGGLMSYTQKSMDRDALVRVAQSMKILATSF